ncbi:MAG: polyprenol monophosphomannose synthase [Candidatus Omnitrophota bacterium]
MANDIVVVVPTYNESENIGRLIEEINLLRLPLDILIVDDNSPDGTGEMVEALKKRIANIDIIHRREKEGLGPAYLEAFRYLLAEGGYKYIVQMDADLSHDPKDIPRLLEAASRCDAAIGSRYVKGGGAASDWGIFRKMISRYGNFYARVIAGLEVSDCTAGFKCYRAEALRSIDLNKKFLNGYGFQVQMLYELERKGFKLCEVPIYFTERRKGASKMSLNIVVEAFFYLLLMRLGIKK